MNRIPLQSLKSFSGGNKVLNIYQLEHRIAKLNTEIRVGATKHDNKIEAKIANYVTDAAALGYTLNPQTGQPAVGTPIPPPKPPKG
jgi:hypothetical protein